MSFDNPFTNGQAQAQAAFLGADKRLENPLFQAGRQATTAVADLHDKFAPPVARTVGAWKIRPAFGYLNPDGAALADGIQGIKNQIQEDLANLTHVGVHKDRFG